MATAKPQADHPENGKRNRISSISSILGTRKVAMKWKGTLPASGYFSRGFSKDPGSFDVNYNDAPEVRKLIEKSRSVFYSADETKDDLLYLNEPENTFELFPLLKVRESEVREVMRSVMEAITKSNIEINAKYCKHLADAIKDGVKSLEFSRYKIVSVVSLLTGSQKPNIMIASRCLWSKEFDNYIQETMENKSHTIIATVYVSYCE